jgi:hypothetical protein
MASLDFYATVEDHDKLLTDVFGQGDVRVFESYSALDRDLTEFAGVNQILDALRQVGQPRLSLLLQLWAPAASVNVEVVRIPVSVPGYSHRYRIAGWGLMQLYLSKETDSDVHHSHFGHFNQRSAEKWSGTLPSPNPGTAADWDWHRLQQISRRIQYRIRNTLSDVKIGSRPVLRGAERLMKGGHNLVAR